MLTLTCTLLLAATVSPPNTDSNSPEAGQSIGLAADADRAARLLPSCAEGSPEWQDATAPEKKQILERCRAAQGSAAVRQGYVPRMSLTAASPMTGDAVRSPLWTAAGVADGLVTGAMVGVLGGNLVSSDGRAIAASTMLVAGLGAGLGYLVGEAARHWSLGARVGILVVLCVEVTVAALVGGLLYSLETHPAALFGSGSGQSWDF